MITVKRVFIVDTNVLVAGLITAVTSSATARIVDAMLAGNIIYLISPALLQEYRAVLLRPKLVRLHGLKESEIDDLLTVITANAVWHDPTSGIGGDAPDPGDNHLWDLLSSEHGAILITGDGLLRDRPPAESSIISPATMVKSFL
ncbi:hypothetical protein A6D6_03235 [Alcanivorax xiamenensis]|uniref:PIN domain-containing protein n=1 Tax=Alcanivorax xiamenensis TaxID=1177156 RepID=A0ABQ6Y4V7_9GAMM|nr:MULTISPECIES: putative toxin-antitoxin system toxin component, PIN family [Alcanivorax]KAF0804239.1 hypothetical protein A6D6_03235 [Alcanivorax xiamenensis]